MSELKIAAGFILLIVGLFTMVIGSGFALRDTMDVTDDKVTNVLLKGAGIALLGVLFIFL